MTKTKDIYRLISVSADPNLKDDLEYFIMAGKYDTIDAAKKMQETLFKDGGLKTIIAAENAIEK